ncbi:unannotated protein [freshwater metagenome]|uniref:Unannotated protein n=1 Tax=freshwater metagenome TaxID=449393 RepID=A0A6J7MQT1_9ZZZZ
MLATVNERVDLTAALAAEIKLVEKSATTIADMKNTLLRFTAQLLPVLLQIPV